MPVLVPTAGEFDALAARVAALEHPTQPPPPLTITCPAAISVQATGQSGQTVSYPAPRVSGGVPPYTLTTLPASGSLFPVGLTTVVCTARDSQGGSVNCSFPITVVAPTPPSSLTATPVSSSQINLAWTDNASTEYGFQIWRCQGAGCTPALIASVGVNVVSFNNTGLSPSTLYRYQVRAMNDGGGSAFSAVAEATTQAVVAPPAGEHGYFNTLVARSDHWKSYSLRTQAQLELYKNGSGVAAVNYLWPNDPDPHQQDAAKVVIPPFEGFARSSLATAINGTDTTLFLVTWSAEFYAQRAVLIDSEAMYITAINATAKTLTVTRGSAGTTAASHAASAQVKVNTNNLQKQVRLPVNTTEGHVYLFTWEGYWTDSYLSPGQYTQKTFQFGNGPNDAIWLEPQWRYTGAYATGFNSATDVASLTIRSYNVVGGPAIYNGGNFLGPGVTSVDPIQPKVGSFIVKPNRWTRFWVRLDMRANDYDYMDYWVADEVQEPVQIYSQIPTTSWYVNKFWLEFNTSQDRYVRGNNTRDLVAYVRNVVILIDPATLPAFDKPQ